MKNVRRSISEGMNGLLSKEVPITADIIWDVRWETSMAPLRDMKTLIEQCIEDRLFKWRIIEMAWGIMHRTNVRITIQCRMKLLEGRMRKNLQLEEATGHVVREGMRSDSSLIGQIQEHLQNGILPRNNGM